MLSGSAAVAASKGDAAAAHTGQAASGGTPGEARNWAPETPGRTGTAQNLVTQQRQKGAPPRLGNAMVLP